MRSILREKRMWTVYQIDKKLRQNCSAEAFYNLSAPFIVRAIFIERRVARVEIFTVKIILRYANGIGEALIVNYFSCAQEFYYVIYIGIV